MIKDLKEAIEHATRTARNLKAEAKAWQGCAIQSKGKVKANECLECAADHEQLAAWLTELQERREADRWISVKDRLPEKLVSVLACDNNDVFVAWYDEGWKSSDSQFDKNTPIVKWLPIHKESEAKE